MNEREMENNQTWMNWNQRNMNEKQTWILFLVCLEFFPLEILLVGQMDIQIISKKNPTNKHKQSKKSNKQT